MECFTAVLQFWQLEHLVHSLSVDNNLVPFQLRWREIVLKGKKFLKRFVQDCIQKDYRSFKNDELHGKLFVLHLNLSNLSKVTVRQRLRSVIISRFLGKIYCLCVSLLLLICKIIAIVVLSAVGTNRWFLEKYY